MSFTGMLWARGKLTKLAYCRLRHLLTAGAIVMLPACTPLVPWRHGVTSESSGQSVLVASLQAPGPQPLDNAPPDGVSSEIAPVAIEGRTPQLDSSHVELEPPPLLPTPAQAVQVSSQRLPRELLPEAEPAPMPRCLTQAIDANEPALVSALRAYVSGQSETALKLLEAYDDRDQQFLLRLFPVLAQLHHAGLYAATLTPQQRLVLLESLRALANEVRTQAPLQIRQATFCRRVLGFGKWEPSPNHFAPGEAGGLYCEIDNLQEQALPSGQYSLALQANLEIRNLYGRTVWQEELHFEPDLARSPRQDHFLFVRWRMPGNLAVGQYTIVLTIRDLPTQRTCSVELPMRIVARSER